ncbi:Aste57867_21111 [Aphanomyces stellatus]|uniref:Aste57867_21111 protein n=1 Tax=Aphanomyces stellatus TaxID=120398 RepID=A0A485LGP1_9STRA|nr:hypothetical protein As57867_021043 [Aphanomyces stellatus]VFT97785.1 Aste57867_21111 [Aphanomyces stellatus]
MMSVGQMCTQDVDDDDSEVEVVGVKKATQKASTSKKPRARKPAPAVEERDSSVHEDDDDDDDDDDDSAKSDNGGGGGGGGDHNRWYCNICKDGGELLCCDRCPRAFHTACLSMDPDDIPRPDSSWYCKLCSDTLDRRKAKRDVKDQKRMKREEEKRQRDLAREAKQREKDEALARRSAKALEDKAKRVLDMKERIVKKQKVSYKDREEEKLGKIAENSAETIRQAKEKLEKLEKEDLALKKKEQSLVKNKRNTEQDESEVGPKPEATPCAFGGIPSNMFRQVLSAWDFVYSFHKIIGISSFSVDQLCDALMSPKFSPLINELHMCLLDLILESREGETYVSEEEAEMDPLDRYRFEVVHAALTVGVPTSNMLNFLSWPAVLRNLIKAVPRYFNNATPAIKAAVAALAETEYPQLSISHKLTLLEYLVTLAYSTDKIGKQINYHVQERTEASKEHNRLLFQEKREKAEENKRVQEQQKADKAKLAVEQKAAMQTWLAGGKKGAAPVMDQDGGDASRPSSPIHTDDASSTQSEDDDDDSGNSTDEDAEELMSLQAKGIISRQEYLARKKKIDAEREARRKEKEERAKKSKQKEQILKKRALLAEEIHLAMEIKDLDRLTSSLRAAKENGMHTVKKPRFTTGAYVVASPQDVKLYDEASEFAERLEADVAKEQEVEERKRAFEKAMREYFVRTQALGKDKDGRKYWLFRGDSKRVYVEQSNGQWAFYDSVDDVNGLLKALGDHNLLKKELLPHVDTLVKEIKKASAASSDASSWHNKAKSWGRSYHDLTVDEVKKELLHVETSATKRLMDSRGTMWVQTTEAAWIKAVEEATTIQHLVDAVLALEREISGQEEIKQVKLEEDEDEEDDDETFVQNSLWPSQRSRERWIGVVMQVKTLSSIALSLSALVQRMDIWGVTGAPEKEKKDTKPKREVKKQDAYHDDDDEVDDMASEASPVKPRRKTANSAAAAGETEWEEYCCICRDGGELLCCDGCPHVFHFTCVGLRRVPRGKTFCPNCDRNVKPVYPVVVPAGALKPASHAPIKSEEEWDAFCGICKNGGELLLCDGCPKAFHVECLKLHDFDPDDDWFCDDCENQSCGTCKKGRIRMDSHVICGNEAGTKGCERVFHLKCVKLDRVPEDDWYCKRCLKQSK